MPASTSDQKDKLKHSRRVKRGAFTRALNVLKAATAEENEKEVVENALERLLNASNGVEQVHDALVAILDTEPELEEAETYIEIVLLEFTQGLQIGKKYLADIKARETSVVDTTTSNREDDDRNVSSNAIAKFLMKKDLISNGLIKFDDSPLNYRSWMGTFKAIVKELSLSAREECDLMIKWLGPESRKIVMRLRAVHLDNPENCLKDMWKRLNEEYGAPELIESVLLKKLETFTRIKDDHQLKEMSDLLREIEVAKSDKRLPGLACFDTARGVNMVTEKLSYQLQDRWRTTGARYKADKDVSFPPFNVFVEFVAKEAKVRNDPSFQVTSASKSRDSHKGNKSGDSARAYSTQSKQKRCFCCDGNHTVEGCDKFKGLELKQREELIRRKGLCRGCLKKGHIWRECKCRRICDICKGEHPTIMHRFSNSTAEPPVVSSNSAAEPPVVSSNSADKPPVVSSNNLCSNTCDNEQCCSSIVPVWIEYEKQESITYALLDEQSDSCFISAKLAQELKTKGVRIQLEISTVLTKGCVTSEKINGLKVRGLKEGKTISLPAAYTRDSIPVSRHQIPTPNSVNGWQHLQKIKSDLSPLLNIEVGLIIGHNCSSALMPREVVRGNHDEDPYAIKTLLGWGVVGVVKARKGEPTNNVKQFSFKTTTKEVIKVLERDFLDDRINGKMISVEDTKFLNAMQKGCRTENGYIQLPLSFKLEIPKLPNNKVAVGKRLIQLRHKMIKQPTFAAKYKEFMTSIIDKSQAEKVPTEELEYEREYGTDAAEFVRRGFYVDDALKAVPTIDGAISLIKRTVDMLSRGGFRLHKFLSNSPEVLKSLPTTSIASKVNQLDLSDLPTERTLGILWNAAEDTFTFEANLRNKPSTRRGILSTVSAIFDPLGFVGPYVLLGKRILPEICAGGAEWDHPVGEETLRSWEEWKKQLVYLKDVSIERCYKPISNRNSEIVSTELHHFSDASEKGYGQCSYLRLVDKEGKVKTSLLISKCRVAPKRMITIPRLELAAAVVSVKVASMLKEEIEYPNVTEYFWTDSQVVIGYINNEAKRFNTFAANRVQQIHDASTSGQWHYVSSADNPADIASRGMDAEKLRDCERWWHGPAFLNREKYTINQLHIEIKDDDVEVRQAKVFATQVKTELTTDMLRRTSSWHKVRQILARCLIFIYKLRGWKRSGEVTVEDLTRSEKLIIKAVQYNEWKDLNALVKLDPVVDNDGLLRVGGRLKKTNLPEEIKHPVIIPAKSDLTRLIVGHYHNQVYHQGRGITLNAVRAAGFWMIGGVASVSRYIHDCTVCRRLRRPTELQRMADLPVERAEAGPAFSYCGVDFFGPIIVKNGRKELKRYGVLFTCLVSRSVHLEIASSLSTDSFMNAFRRFLCRRGPVRQMRSDQGTNFIGATRELKEAVKEMDQEAIRINMLRLNCDWKFNTPTASHHGGAWERMIRTTRNIFDSLMLQHKALLNDDMLSTFMTEAEAIINSRPLCATNDASLEPLTPFHLITMKSSAVYAPPGNFKRDGKFSRKLWRRVQHLADTFWSRWQKEYIINLQQRQKWTKKKRNISIGDIVLLYEEGVPRNHWELARVTNTKPSDDGLVRSVTVTVTHCHFVTA
ncbi:uncharacterized protein [Antedon mediterranea]|uniref:uncharacterized protein n=1 Tax=Antedon mediterranea TaxID=105859 RepID=UPI003AF545B1